MSIVAVTKDPVSSLEYRFVIRNAVMQASCRFPTNQCVSHSPQ